MTAETKTFDPLTIGTLTTGIVLSADARWHEAVEWILGRPVWTHELPGAAKEICAAILAVYPGFPADEPDDWQALAAALTARYPDGLVFARGNTVRTLDPVTTARMLTDAPVIAVEAPTHDR